ncbi:MAG: Fic family protein [Nitrospirota bacterium]
MISELDELRYQDAWDMESLLNYYKKWHYNRELYHLTINNIDRKQFVINSLGYRGYGVNKDLLGALEAIKNEYAGHAYWLMGERFKRHIDFTKRTIYLPQELIDSMDSHYIITELCKKLRWNPEENIPRAAYPVGLNPGHYFHVMGGTPWPVNTAIFQKLFLNLGNSSMTLMKGSMGYHNVLPHRDLKIIGNRNFIDIYKEIFSSLHNFTAIGIDLLKRIHYVLSKDITPNAGNFRSHDFHDRNGVTFDFGNFQREIGDLAHVLWETGQSFHHIDDFIYNLSRSYYMFIGIHPFWDSNGRVGKCFLNYMFLKKGIPPVSFKDEDEVFALPRYGGSMKDMHDYIKMRVMRAVDSYFYEKWKMEHFGLFTKRIYNVSFDSGFHFRQIDDRPRKLEVNFNAYLIDDSNPSSWQYQGQCRVVFPSEHLLYNMTIYCGFSYGRRGEWEHVFSPKNNFFIKEIKSETSGVRVFDVSFVVELRDVHYNYDYFNCCVVSHEGGRIFNNNGLNYSYRIEK